jgi:hypothetical protein
MGNTISIKPQSPQSPEEALNENNNKIKPQSPEEALNENNNKINSIRYDNLYRQDKINELTNRLNNINSSINKLTYNPQYKASGELKFY